MDKKMISAVAVVAILVVAAVAVFVTNNNDESNEPSTFENAELKVLGNINGDRYINQADVDLIQKLVDQKATVAEYPLADANHDGVIDAADVQVVKDITLGKSTTIWHINYHDTNKDGTMDEELVSTQFPIKSAIMTASSNTAMLMFTLGIVNEIKGASYSSLDKALFGNSYLNTDKVVKLGKSSTTITFEDGKAGSSDVIAKEGVTAVISDWNRSYLTNESAFESANIDVVRVAAASLDKDVMTHSALLIGLLFQKMSRAIQYLDTSFELMDYVEGAVKDVEPVSAVASSTNGSISSLGSDYTQLLLRAGASFGAEGIEYGGSSSIKIKDHPEFNTVGCERVIHIRTALNYDQTPESVKKAYDDYTAEFSTWQHADDGQFMISGSIPVALRLAYAAAALHPDVVDINKVDRYHQVIANKLYDGVDFNISSMSFLVEPDVYA